MNAPKHIGSAAPFAHAARQYNIKGWNVIPLPVKLKKSPPSKDDDPLGEGFTGRGGRLVTAEDIQRWIDDGGWTSHDSQGNEHFIKLGNIAIRPGNVVEHDGEKYSVIGIDVDSYGEKTGGAQLIQLEKKYGPLPNTWISSARADGVSGIRWFLAPAGLEYMGKPVMPDTDKASDSIEIVQRVHRYGLVFPSMHPEGMQYRWYDRGQPPDGVHHTDQIPTVTWLAPLPERWWKFLSRNGIESAGSNRIDMQSSNQQLREWQRKRWVDGADMCDKVSKAMENALEDIENAGDHHEPLVRMHWHLYKLGSEGHTGWESAVLACESAWNARVLEEGVRSPAESKYERARSRFGVLRKIKGDYDYFKRRGCALLETEDPCEAIKLPPPPKPRKVAKRPLDYERNEDGNAQHFLDLMRGNVKVVVNSADGAGKWLVFNETTKRWEVDTMNDIVRHHFRRVKARQMRAAERAVRLAAQAVAVAGGAQAVTPAQNAALKEARAWVDWARESGNKARVANSLAQAQTFPGVSLLAEQLDRDTMLLPCANGVLRFATREQRLAGAKPFEFVEDSRELKRLLITQNTHVPYIPFREQKKHPDPEVRANYKVFVEFMTTFLKNHMAEETWDYVLRLLGFSILGINAKKAIFLVGLRDTGKSTFQSMMAAALGDLSIWRDPDIFIDSPFKPALAEALPRRVAMVGELGEKHIDASLFKRVTGGVDEVTCNLKNVNSPFSMVARCTIISACNSAPEVPGVDDATKERFVVIPFRHQVTRTEKDPSAQDRLMEACKVPLLAMLVDACAEGIVKGIQEVPEELQLETREFVSSLNEMGDFIRDRLILLPEDERNKYQRKDMDDPREPKPRMPDEMTTGQQDLWNAWREYAKRNGMEAMSSNKFTRRLKDAGLVRDGSKNKEGDLRWLGVTLKGSDRVHTAKKS